jgi:hypothetical protein
VAWLDAERLLLSVHFEMDHLSLVNYRSDFGGSTQIDFNILVAAREMWKSGSGISGVSLSVTAPVI